MTPALDRHADIVAGQVLADGCTGAPLDEGMDLSGITVVMEDGSFAQTDEEGRFTFRDVRRGSHVLSLDHLSLPRDLAPVLCRDDPRSAGSSTSRFVEARGGFLRRVRFHLGPERFVDHPDPLPPEEVRAADYDAAYLDRVPRARGLLFPTEGYLPRGRSIDIVGAFGRGETLLAFVNDAPVPASHRRPGQSPTEARAGLGVWEAVAIESGRNTVTLVRRGATGAEISRQSATILFASDPGRLEVIEEASILSSDGRTRPVVVLRATADGIPLHPGTLVDIRVSDPFRLAERSPGEDAEREIDRLTARVDADGLLRVRLAPVSRPGRATFAIDTVDGEATAQAMISTKGRPFYVVGIASGTLSESSIARHMRPGGEVALGEAGHLKVSGRGAFFTQGVIRGKWLLTARYDSARAGEVDDFFGIDPDADYIVYADGSREGDGAQSRHALYLRIEGDSSDLLYGDFDTNIGTGVATYMRRLTGARAIWGNDVLSVRVFASETSQVFVEDRIPANGTSGPFHLERDAILPFSETILVETSDRDAAGRILSSRILVRGTDYDIDYQSGRIFLDDPLPARSADLDPNAIVVRYEVEAEKGDSLILGGRVEARPAAGPNIGATIVREGNIAGTDGGGTLLGGDVSIGDETGFKVDISAGYSRQDVSLTLPEGSDGYAGEVRLGYATATTEASAYLRRETQNFGIDNQSLSRDRLDTLGAEIRRDYTMDPDSGTGRALHGAYSVERNVDARTRRDKIEIGHDWITGERVSGLALRGEKLRGASGSGQALMLHVSHARTILGESGRLSFGQEIGIHRDGDLDIPALGTAELQFGLTDRVEAYATAEIALSEGDAGGILGGGLRFRPRDGTRLSFGAKASPTRDAAPVAILAGADQETRVSGGTVLSFGVEGQAPATEAGEAVTIAGLPDAALAQPYWSAHAGLEQAGEAWSCGGRLEIYRSDTSDKLTARATLRRHLAGGAEAGIRLRSFSEHAATDRHETEVIGSIAWRPSGGDTLLIDRLRAAVREEKEGQSTARLVNSLYYSRALERGHEINLRHGLKLSDVSFTSGSAGDVLNLVGAEYRHRLGNTFDVGTHGSVLHSMSGRETDSSAGASLGITPFENAWVSVGYNWTGFEDADFSEGGETAKGAFVQFRVKFDSDSLTSLFGLR